MARVAAARGDRTADACVVGLGGSGLAAVEALLDRGLSRRRRRRRPGRAAGAAGRNGGFLLGGPRRYLHTAIEAWGADAAVWLYRATLAELDRLVQTLGPDVVRRVGSIRLAGLPGEPRDRRRGGRSRRRAGRLRPPTRRRCAATASRCSDYDGPLGHGLFLPDDAAMNPARRALGLAALLRDRAALHEQTRVRTVEAGRVVTEHGTVSAAWSIVAVDGRLDVLLPALAGAGAHRPAADARDRAGPPRRLPCPVYGRWGYDYAQQDASGRICSCGGGRDLFVADEWTTDADPTGPVQALHRAGGVPARRATGPGDPPLGSVGGLHRRRRGRAVHRRSTTGVVACGGYNGTGNLVGPVAARAAVALALDGTPPPSYLAHHDVHT